MNLTTPPPVEPLDPEYATDLRQDLVRRARKKRRLPTWTPVLAAACGIAVVVAGGLLIVRTNGEPSPAGQVPADAPTQSLELGQPTQSDALAAAKSCLTTLTNDRRNDPVPPEAARDPKTIKLRSAHSIEAVGLPGQTRQLVQTFYTGDRFWVFCVDGKWQGYAAPGDDQGNPSDGIYSSGLQWSGLPSDPLPTLRATFSLTSRPSVVRVELRLRGARGETPWSQTKVIDGAGYVAAALPGDVAKHGPVQADVRAYDQAGNMVYSETFDDK
ncbi:hypothetical protein OHA18_40285 [Kribbella sp. NBC_00709]|uniref:hypothetical protein n=1 Tax=Kribbella sp. NBC_00709 TaxID=2975972 RepID=UPI002E2BE2DC|nr:hypothetical protein [Kribbella sp. NBC_00709]